PVQSAVRTVSPPARLSRPGAGLIGRASADPKGPPYPGLSFAGPWSMIARRTAVCAAALLALTIHVPEACAQIDNRLAVGMSVTSRIASSSSAAGTADVGFELRLGHERPGWGPEVSFFSWFDTDVQQSLAGRQSELGQLRIRPIMAGYGYTWNRGRTTLTADV